MHFFVIFIKKQEIISHKVKMLYRTLDHPHTEQALALLL